MRANLPVLSLALAVFTGPVLAQPGADAGPPTEQPKAKATLDDRADPNVRSDEVGKPGRMGRKALPPGVYINDKHRQEVRDWYAAHPAGASAVKWQIGEKLSSSAAASPVPGAVLVLLPKAPPGTRYVQLGSDVLLIADGSHMVVDGVSAK
jgi:hypothetical protein